MRRKWKHARAFGLPDRSQAVRMLDRYTDMRAREELTEEEFRAKKAGALKEKNRCFSLLNDIDAQITRWADNMETALNFAAHAKEEFEGGDLERRRSIFRALGSNLILKDKKVSIDLEKALLPMRRLASAVQDIHAALEPQKHRMKQADFEEIYSQSPTVSALRDDVRTALTAALAIGVPLFLTALKTNVIALYRSSQKQASDHRVAHLPGWHTNSGFWQSAA